MNPLWMCHAMPCHAMSCRFIIWLFVHYLLLLTYKVFFVLAPSILFVWPSPLHFVCHFICAKFNRRISVEKCSIMRLPFTTHFIIKIVIGESSVYSVHYVSAAFRSYFQRCRNRLNLLYWNVLGCRNDSTLPINNVWHNYFYQRRPMDATAFKRFFVIWSACNMKALSFLDMTE